MRNKYKKILVVNTFGIGDVLFSTPLIKALKQEMPDTRIDFMCNRRCHDIFKNNKNIEKIILFEKDEFRSLFRESKILFLKKMITFAGAIKRQRYDLAIDLSLGYQISLFLKLMGIKKRIGFNYRKRGKYLTGKVNIGGFNDKHAAEYYLDIVKLLDIYEVKDKDFEFCLSREEEGWASDFVREHGLENKILVGIAPGGGKSWGVNAIYRRWAPQNFSRVAKKLCERDEDIFFICFGSQEERSLCDLIVGQLGMKAINLCGALSLLKTAALLKRCRLLLCNDGGLLHLAVSQGTRTVSIFGPVDEKVYGPYPASEKHLAIKAQNLACRPCYRNFKHELCEEHKCLKKIQPDVVLKSAEKALGL